VGQVATECRHVISWGKRTLLGTTPLFILRYNSSINFRLFLTPSEYKKLIMAQCSIMVQFKSSAENLKHDFYTSTTLTNLAMIHHENTQYVASFRSTSTASSLQTHSLYFLIQLLIIS
jgi:hypothetical protein